MVPVTLARPPRRLPDRHVLLRRIPLGILFGAVGFAVAWVLFWAPNTNFGPAIDAPDHFVITLLDSLTFAAELFIVASGFALIFGLMRVVNMAHGSFFLLGGYIAYDMQQYMANNSADLFVPSSSISAWDWIVPALVASICIAGLGLVIQQVFLRWNQGQDLRQALITIAISVIIADQVIAHFHFGLARELSWPGFIADAGDGGFLSLHVFGVSYSIVKLVVILLGACVASALWLWLYRTRTGMVIRAGVDDRQMTSAIGINIQKTFAIAFVVGSALAAFGATVGASQQNVANGSDGQWLLNALVVVVVGGMGSIFGAAAGALLYGLVFTFAASYLPTADTQYAVVFTFILLAFVLAFRPQGLFGRPG